MSAGTSHESDRLPNSLRQEGPRPYGKHAERQSHHLHSRPLGAPLDCDRAGSPRHNTDRGGPAQAATTILAAPNPFDGVTPDFSIFGLQFTQAWQKLLGGAWGIGFVFTAFSAIRATVALARAKKGGYGVQVAEQTEDAKWAGIAFGALSMLGVIVGGVIAVFQ